MKTELMLRESNSSNSLEQEIEDDETKEYNVMCTEIDIDRFEPVGLLPSTLFWKSWKLKGKIPLGADFSNFLQKLRLYRSVPHRVS